VVKEFSVPRDVHNVQHFLGLSSFYRRFVISFVRTAHPREYELGLSEVNRYVCVQKQDSSLICSIVVFIVSEV